MKQAVRTYQPIWVRGEEKENPYQRPSAERYEPIRELASKFNRRFSVLDIGSNYAYFDMRLQEDFDCVTVMVDKKFIGDVLKYNNAWDRSAVIQNHLKAAELEALSRSEHFDIVLGLAVLHHFDEPKRAYEAMRKLGWWTIFEIPGHNDIGAANPQKHEEIAECFRGEVPCGTFPSHVSDTERPYYILENEPYIWEQSIDSADRDAPIYSEYAVECDFDQSIFIKRSTDMKGNKTESRHEFVPGMNYHNFLILNGMWPNPPDIDAKIALIDHPDKQPWNFVIPGPLPIDTDDKFA